MDDTKQTPGGTPSVPHRLLQGLQEAIAHPARREGAHIEVTASGGVAGERYEFEYSVDVTGAAVVRLRDQLKDRAVDGRAEPDPGRFGELVRALDVERLLAAGASPPRFVPDSVVGFIEISDGEQTVRLPFPVKPGSMVRERPEEAAGLAGVADAVFAQAAQLAGTDDLRP